MVVLGEVDPDRASLDITPESDGFAKDEMRSIHRYPRMSASFAVSRCRVLGAFPPNRRGEVERTLRTCGHHSLMVSGYGRRDSSAASWSQ